MSGPVLIIDDDPDLQELVAYALRREGIGSARALSAAEAFAWLDGQESGAIVVDLELPDATGEDVLERVRLQRPEVPCVVLSAQDDVDRIVRCMQAGALDFVAKPFDPVRLVTSVRNAVTQGELRRQLATLSEKKQLAEGLRRFLGRSAPVRKALALMERAAASDVTVLLQGESGTGKEVAARAIHAESRRRSGPFLAINCGAIPEGMIESELFGHEKGAFTGAVAARRGCFEEAHGGTIFLDEIGELRADLQVRLLRVLQERQIQRVGSSQLRPVDVRVLAATHKDLAKAIRDGEFREDLYYRLAVFPIELPPLRDRGDDVILLAQHFVAGFADAHGKPIGGMDPAYVDALSRYSWRGNVRELENVIERSVILEDGTQLSFPTLPEVIQLEVHGEVVPLRITSGEPDALDFPVAGSSAGIPGTGAEAATATPIAGGTAVVTAPRAPGEILPFDVEERRIVENALAATGGNVREAARRLRIGRATIYRKMEKYGIPRES